MTRVRTVVARNTILHAFNDCLQIVAPLRADLRAGNRCYQNMAELIRCDGIHRCGSILRSCALIDLCSGYRLGTYCRMRTVKHQTGDRLNTAAAVRHHQFCKILRSFFGTQTPVFIGIQLAVFVQILECKAIIFQQVYS